MKTKLLVIICVIVNAFLLTSCTTGVSQAEFDELKGNLENAENELSKIKDEFDGLESELEALIAHADGLESELEALRAYANVFDVSADQMRMSLGRPTIYGFLGPGQSPDFIENFIRKAESTGNIELKKMVEHAFELPWGDAKQKAWNEVYVYLSDCMMGR